MLTKLVNVCTAVPHKSIFRKVYKLQGSIFVASIPQQKKTASCRFYKCGYRKVQIHNFSLSLSKTAGSYSCLKGSLSKALN